MGTTKVCGTWHADCPDKWRKCHVYEDGVYVDTITEYKPNPACNGEPEPEEPHWEPHSTYRGIDIQVWMPDGTPFTAYFDGSWHMAALLSTLKAAIDDFLEPEPPAKIPTIISIMVSPKTGAPPYTTRIEGELYGEDGSRVAFATVHLYRDEEWIDSTSTDAAGFYSFTQVITEPHDFYAEFLGNDEYEGCV